MRKTKKRPKLTINIASEKGSTQIYTTGGSRWHYDDAEQIFWADALTPEEVKNRTGTQLLKYDFQDLNDAKETLGWGFNGWTEVHWLPGRGATRYGYVDIYEFA